MNDDAYLALALALTVVGVVGSCASLAWFACMCVRGSRQRRLQ